MKKNTRFPKIFLLSLFLISLFSVGKAQPIQIWGAATNGLELGMSVTNSSGIDGRYDLVCEVDIQNTSANRSIFLQFAPPEQRYEMELLDPKDGRVDAMPEALMSKVKRPFRRGTAITNEVNQTDWFFISDVFDIKTNGIYTLIVSERATTNNIRGKQPAFFLFPPVTNKFIISAEQPKK